MTYTQTISSNRIALHGGKKEARPAEVVALGQVFEKSTTELKLKQKLLKCKRTIQIAIFNARTLKRIGQLPELTALVRDHNVDIIYIQEHWSIHREDIKYRNTGNGWTSICASAWKNSVNITIWGVRILIGPWALKSQNSIEKIHPRMMVATFNGNPCATIISSFNPFLASEETDLIAFYPPLFVASRNTTFSSSVEIWMLKSVKM